MNWDARGELRADPARAPGERNIEVAGKRRSIWPSIFVAAAAAAFIGVIWFAYRNGREASQPSGPPLVKAEPGPVKIKPDNPGGQEIPFQDSTVYDRLSQNGQKPVMEKLLPPPEAPVERSSAAPMDSSVDSKVATTAIGAAPSVPQQPIPPPPPPANADIASPTALAPSPDSIIAQPPPEKPTTVAPKSVETKPVETKPVETKPVETKPVTVTPPAKAPHAADSIAALIASESPAVTPKAGGYRIRLSAVRSEEAVEPEWARLKRKFPELATLKTFTSKTDQPGKGIVYRLEAGPLDESAAKSTCDQLRMQGLGCIVVKP